MAEPVLTASLLTPVSLRLSWTYSGSADFEVFWKSDHPASQEYVLLGRTTGSTYDVGSLNWSTIYYFKVRAVSGGTYGAFSNEINVFVCCGQGVLSGAPTPGNPPTELLYAQYWQQSVDQSDGNIAFAVKTKDDTAMLLYSYDGGLWKYLGGATYDNQFQAAVRRLHDAIAVFDMYSLYQDWGWYKFSYWDGNTFRSSTLPIANQDFLDYMWVNVSLPSVTASMEFNEDGRIVVGLCYVNWYYDNPYNCTFSIMVSYDRGNSWSAEIVVETFQTSEIQKIALAESGDGTIWITTTKYTDPGDDTWDAPKTVCYGVYKWTPSGGVQSVKTITTALTSIYGGPPLYQIVDPAVLVAQCSIYAEGSRIVVAYPYSHTLTGSGTPWWGENTVYVEVSNNYGATWSAPKQVTHSDVFLHASNWRATIPVVCIASGALLLFAYGGTPAANTYYILRSNDDGDSWSTVYTFPGVVANFGFDAEFRSDGDHVTFAGCGMTVGANHPMAYFESFDAGLTWAAVEIVPDANPQILVPA